MKLFFDGACLPNPGEMQVAVVAAGKIYHKPKLGYGTSEQAEWLALLYALEVSRMLGFGDILLLGDSASVINQANGRTRCRSPELQQHLDTYKEQAACFSKIRIRHIKRTQNLAGIALERLSQKSSLRGA